MIAGEKTSAEGDEHRTWLVSLATGSLSDTFDVTTTDIHPDGHALLAPEGNETRLISAEDGESLGRNPGAYGLFSAGGRYVITSAVDQPVRLWDPTAGALVAELRGQAGMQDGFTDLSDRYVVTLSSLGSAWLWDSRTGEQLSVLTGYREAVREGEFLPDIRTIITIGNDPGALLFRCELCGGAT